MLYNVFCLKTAHLYKYQPGIAFIWTWRIVEVFVQNKIINDCILVTKHRSVNKLPFLDVKPFFTTFSKTYYKILKC